MGYHPAVKPSLFAVAVPMFALSCASPDDNTAGVLSTSLGTTSPGTVTTDGELTTADTTSDSSETVGSSVTGSGTTQNSDSDSDSETESNSESSSTGEAPSCPPGSKPGSAGSSDGVSTSAGVNINVRTPANYDPTVAYPVVVVFAPAVATAAQTEAFTGLTADALAAGYVIAYADHVSPMTIPAIEQLGAILDDIAETWCIDPARVFFTGHSDGGTISEVLLALDQSEPRPRAAAPSAAGINGPTMMQIGCPAEPTPIMIIHSANDDLFQVANGFGADTASVWANCNGCVGAPVEEGPCIRWLGCTDDVATLYCETSGSHGQWTNLNAEMFAFFAESVG